MNADDILGEAILTQLAAGGTIAARVMIVVAHPDDETIGLGAQLARFEDALLVHVTDGAPRDGHDARNYGFATSADYAAARQAELAAALDAGEAGHVRTTGLDVPDKEAWRDLAGVARRIADLLRAEKPAVVFTHACEGGHPDHDAAAFAVHAACRLAPDPPAVLEFPLYHRGPGRLVTGQFLPWSPREPGRVAPAPHPSPLPAGGEREITQAAATAFPLPAARGEGQGEGLKPRGRLFETVIPLASLDRRRKQAMVDCFATQRWLLGQFDIATERFRIAPAYDFREPPHPGELHYETLGWGITGPEWRRAAATALERLGLGTARCR